MKEPIMTTLARTVLLAASMMLAVGLHAADKMSPDKKPANPDESFVTQALQDGMAEVQLGKLAQQNGSSAKVKDFGKRMITDHSKAGDELKALATKLGIKPPGGPNEKQQAEFKKLSALKGDKFDNEYANHMVHDHETAVTLFQKQAKHGEVANLKQFASKTLPVLEEHLKMARELKAGK
jgi:putative membrane protein